MDGRRKLRDNKFNWTLKLAQSCRPQLMSYACTSAFALRAAQLASFPPFTRPAQRGKHDFGLLPAGKNDLRALSRQTKACRQDRLPIKTKPEPPRRRFVAILVSLIWQAVNFAKIRESIYQPLTITSLQATLPSPFPQPALSAAAARRKEPNTYTCCCCC